MVCGQGISPKRPIEASPCLKRWSSRATAPSSKHPPITTALHAEAGERPDCCRVSVSEMPRRDQFEPGCLEILEVSSRQPATIDARYRRDHSVRNRHPSPLPRSVPHNISISQCSFFRKGKHLIGEPSTPAHKPLFQSICTLIWPDLLNTKSDLSNCDSRQCQLGIVANQPCYDCRIGSFFQSFRDDIRIEKNQSSTPL